MSYKNDFESAVVAVINDRRAARKLDKYILEQIEYTDQKLVIESYQTLERETRNLFSDAKNAKIIDPDRLNNTTKLFSNKIKDLLDVPVGHVVQTIKDSRARATYGVEIRPILKKYFAAYILEHSSAEFNQKFDAILAYGKQLRSEIDRMMSENSDEVERIRDIQWQQGEGARRQEALKRRWNDDVKKRRLDDSSQSRSMRNVFFDPQEEEKQRAPRSEPRPTHTEWGAPINEDW